MNYVLESENIDTIMHFAAQTHVDNSFGNSFQFTQNNIYGTHVLLESAKNHGIKRFVHVSTDEVGVVYGWWGWVVCADKGCAFPPGGVGGDWIHCSYLG